MIDWHKEAASITHEDFGEDTVRAVAFGMAVAYARGAKDGAAEKVTQVAELRALLKLALVLHGAENDPPTVPDEWKTWVYMVQTKLKELEIS